MNQELTYYAFFLNLKTTLDNIKSNLEYTRQVIKVGKEKQWLNDDQIEELQERLERIAELSKKALDRIKV